MLWSYILNWIKEDIEVERLKISEFVLYRLEVVV